jgi:hypothetical protein
VLAADGTLRLAIEMGTAGDLARAMPGLSTRHDANDACFTA